MDTSEQFILMCAKATETQEMKIEHGFQEGDCFYSGTTTHLCGADYVAINKWAATNDYPVFLFAIQKDGSVNFDYYDSYIHLQYGKYVFKKYYKPIWLPRMDQLWEMISEDSIVNLWAFGFYMSNDYKHDDPYMMDDVKSVEQGLIMFVMKIKHNKRWTGKDWVKIDV